MKGKTLIMKNFGNSEEWEYWMKTRNARRKKDSWCKSEAKRVSRSIRRKSKVNLNEIEL